MWFTSLTWLEIINTGNLKHFRIYFYYHFGRIKLSFPKIKEFQESLLLFLGTPGRLNDLLMNNFFTVKSVTFLVILFIFVFWIFVSYLPRCNQLIAALDRVFINMMMEENKAWSIEEKFSFIEITNRISV